MNHNQKPPFSSLFSDSLPVSAVLTKYQAGPRDGIFTDGCSIPNPGPGGWGLVHVKNGEILAQKHGYDPDTTNNRMELTALIEALKLTPPDSREVVYSDSNLCVQTVNKWAAGWEKRGWRRKEGPIKNLELVKELYGLKLERPLVRVEWIKAHNGWLWNEYADSLASAWTRDEV